MDYKQLQEKIKSEYEFERSPGELISWGREIMGLAKDFSSVDNHKILNKVRTEVLPVLKFLEHKKAEFKLVKLVDDNDNFDGVFQSENGDGYFEVTCAKDGNLLAKQAMHMDAYGSAPKSGINAEVIKSALKPKPVKKIEFSELVKITGTEDAARELDELLPDSNEVHSHPEFPEEKIKEVASLANGEITKKLGKEYNKGTILIVGVDDSSLDEDEYWDRFVSQITAHSGQSMFAEIYLVGTESNKLYKLA